MLRRPTIALFTSFLILTILTGCHQPAPPGTGINGVVKLGPTCPVESLASPCPDRPFQGGVRATASDGSTTTVSTDAQGRFTMDLRAGTYVVVAISVSGGGPPTPVPQTVQVRTGSYTRVTLEVDTGIR
ncbi:MAG: hypothetical protein ACXWEG_03945 [Actinomycetota bacterium]